MYYDGKDKLKEKSKYLLIELITEDGAPASYIDNYSGVVEEKRGRTMPPSAKLVLVRLCSDNKKKNNKNGGEYNYERGF